MPLIMPKGISRGNARTPEIIYHEKEAGRGANNAQININLEPLVFVLNKYTRPRIRVRSSIGWKYP